MSNEKIRGKILNDAFGKNALIGFENCIEKVQFYKGIDGYYIYKYGLQCTTNNMLCHSKNLEGLIQFMQGALWFRNNKK